jgi:hypothetical protein
VVVVVGVPSIPLLVLVTPEEEEELGSTEGVDWIILVVEFGVDNVMVIFSNDVQPHALMAGEIDTSDEKRNL